MKNNIYLKVDVDTWRGTVEGVPRLLKLFARHQVRATFLFSLGQDHTGRALRRVFRPGFLGKVGRTSVISHYGLRTLLYGVLLPGPHIARQGAGILRQVAAEGHQVGVHCHDHIRWQDYVAHKDAAWTHRELEQAVIQFQEVFGHLPEVHGAAGWQVNAHALVQQGSMGFRYASDTRGRFPFWPMMDGLKGGVPQLPTTVPTLDELLGREGWNAGNIHQAVIAATQEALPHGHVYTLHAELEGMRLMPVMEELLLAWRAEGRRVDGLDILFNGLEDPLPRHQVVWGEVVGRTGQLALQGPSC